MKLLLICVTLLMLGCGNKNPEPLADEVATERLQVDLLARGGGFRVYELKCSAGTWRVLSWTSGYGGGVTVLP